MRISLVLRAVATSWVAVIANAVVGFLLTPYVLHRLGDEAFGVWVLITNLVGYYGLVDAGVRSAILRYVSRHKELKDQKSVNEVVATAFYYYLGACMLVILATHFSVDAVSRFFSIDSTVHSAFKSLFLLAGLVQGLILPLMVFASSLEAAGRFDQVYLTNVACLALRVIAIIYVLRAGGGLFAVGATTILSQLLAYTIQVPLAIRAQRGLTLHPKWIRKTVLWDMLRYGSISVGVGIAEKMKAYIYPVVIARFLTPVAVTFFALPMKILAFPAEGIGSMTEIIKALSGYLHRWPPSSSCSGGNCSRCGLARNTLLRTLSLSYSRWGLAPPLPSAAFNPCFSALKSTGNSSGIALGKASLSLCLEALHCESRVSRVSRLLLRSPCCSPVWS